LGVRLAVDQTLLGFLKTSKSEWHIESIQTAILVVAAI